MLNPSCDLCQHPAPNDRILDDGSNCLGIIQANLSIAEALQLLEREHLTPGQLQAIAQTLHEAWR